MTDEPPHDLDDLDPPGEAGLDTTEADETPSVITSLGPAAWLGGAWLVVPALAGFLLVAAGLPLVSGWFEQIGTLPASGVYVAVFIVAAGFGLLPTYAQAILGGWAFGPVLGTLLALAGFVGASIVGRAIARTVSHDRVDATIDAHPRARAVRDALIREGTFKTLGIVTLIRVPPNSPFSLTNLVLAGTRVPLWIYTVGTAVGMLPRTALVVWVASETRATLELVASESGGAVELSTDAIKQQRPGWYIPVLIASAIGVALIIMHIANKAIAKVIAEEQPEEDTEDADV